MKERGVIFNSEMVRAILDGRKTQTRRVVNNVIHGNCLWLKKPTKTKSGTTTHVLDAPKYNLCPLGKVGDHLWVRETFTLLGNEDGVCINWNDQIVYESEEAAIIYKASCEQKDGDYGLWSIPDDADWKPHTDNHKYEGTWCPSIHMPRWASRITLEITNVRVEQLQNISEQDALAEGIVTSRYGNDGNWKEGFYLPDNNQPYQTAQKAFCALWQSIYGVNSFYKNPWVWVIEFKRV